MTYKQKEYKTQVQIVRERFGVTVHDMAQGVVNFYNVRAKNPDAIKYDTLHIELVISHIESYGRITCPKPRKTYELKEIAKWMSEVSKVNYQPGDLIEERPR